MWLANLDASLHRLKPNSGASSKSNWRVMPGKTFSPTGAVSNCLSRTRNKLLAEHSLN